MAQSLVHILRDLFFSSLVGYQQILKTKYINPSFISMAFVWLPLNTHTQYTQLVDFTLVDPF